jgi:hypothetical protein
MILNTRPRFATRLTAVSVAVALFSAGCASTGQNSNAQHDAVTGAVIGCGIGILFAKKGQKNEDCLKGATVGGLIGYFVGKQKDAEQAQRLAENLRRTAGKDVAVDVRYRTETVPPEARQNELANVSQVQVLDEFVVTVPSSKLANNDSKVQNTLRQVGSYVAGVQSDTSVNVSAQQQQSYEYVVDTIRTGYPKGAGTQKVQYKYNETPRANMTTVRVAQSTQQHNI